MSEVLVKPEWKLADAKNRLSELVDRAQSEGPQLITRSGKKVAVVVGYEEYESEHREEDRSFIDHLLAIPPAEDDDYEFERLPLKPRDIRF